MPISEISWTSVSDNQSTTGLNREDVPSVALCAMSDVPWLWPGPGQRRRCGLFLSTPFPAVNTGSNWKFGWPCLFTWLKCGEVVFIFSWRVLSSAALQSLPLRSLWEREKSVEESSGWICVCVDGGCMRSKIACCSLICVTCIILKLIDLQVKGIISKIYTKTTKATQLRAS